MAKITKAKHIEALTQTALAAVAYVGFANYDHRERAAKIAVCLAARTGKYVDPDECCRE